MFRKQQIARLPPLGTPRGRIALALTCTAAALVLALAIALGGPSDGSHTGDRPSSASSGTPRTADGSFAGAAYPPGVRAYDFTLTDQHGRGVALHDYRGRPVVLAFVSSGCRTCALVAQQVRGALGELGDAARVPVLFVSTDPTTDTRAARTRFLEEASLTGQARYLAGTTAQLERVWRAYGIAPMSEGREASEAGTSVVLVGREGDERVGFGVEQITPEGLAHDIRALSG